MSEQELSSKTPLNKQDAMQSGQWYSPETYYQILLVTPHEKKTEGQYIKTTIVAKSMGEFREYLIDPENKEKLKPYCQTTDGNSIGSYLPSPGVMLAKGFEEVVFPSNSSHNQRVAEVNNFYESARTLLHSRKISQLIAKTWYSYLEAKATEDWNNFVSGKWDKIDPEMLNGLIAREIFFVDQSYSPSSLEPENLNIYYPLESITKSTEKPRFLILPSSKAWQGIALSLLMAGQAYREVKESGKTYYHQISQPILSTGEIVNRYGLEVEWNTFKGDIKELQVSPGKSSTAFQAVIPYPPIPSERNLSLNEIKNWADADDEEGELPFYSKENGKFLVDVQYFLAPYPYIPLSCC
ncbi:hypothetical protein [Nodularia sp. NIES-3585]|uniref:hypothetical protein n=1 Tax=Nodularia sp. NIES-3585 TaxID=1973477 RepID=UPI000B757676|nr:hypothetical protein [Nodularia sp. NIES-3585]GAX34653.1 hypothetical protein NIES3585_06540 [Nodularia sp. NIES-3585]